jgi:hypothetical protein
MVERVLLAGFDMGPPGSSVGRVKTTP